jgi:hypothetical protein
VPPAEPAKKDPAYVPRFKPARALVKSVNQTGRIIIGFSKDMIIRDALPKDEDIKVEFLSESTNESITGDFRTPQDGRLLSGSNS